MHFGMPAGKLAREMPEPEFRQWARRAREQWLPQRRIEWYLAQIAHLIAVTMGGVKDASVSDFMLDLHPVDQAVDLDAAKEFFGFNPRKKR